MGFKPDIHIFNEGKSRVILNWSPVAQAYYVYREDGIHLPQSTHPRRYFLGGNLRIHNEFDAAKRDYEERVGFIAEMEAVQ
jgi:hypothetical protein